MQKQFFIAAVLFGFGGISISAHAHTLSDLCAVADATPACMEDGRARALPPRETLLEHPTTMRKMAWEKWHHGHFEDDQEAGYPGRSKHGKSHAHDKGRHFRDWAAEDLAEMMDEFNKDYYKHGKKTKHHGHGFGKHKDKHKHKHKHKWHDDHPAVVPAPAALWLFGSGIIGLAITARRKRMS